ncbi:MAG TPA: ABC transporter permease subunit [Verrucomicrobiae bacterium]|nr:ABC transporter permease subunit [Verrucomicrobiae bacterium]
MKTISLIAADSIRGLLHQRLLLGLMLACLGLTVFFSIALAKTRKNITSSFSDGKGGANMSTVTNRMSETEQRQFRESMENASSMMQAFFYQVASFGGSLVALFIFGTAVSSEIRRGTIRLTLSKPVSRTQFLLGKYLGGVAVMAGYAVIATLAILVFAQSEKVDLSPAMNWAPWLMFCRQLMLGSVAMLLSLFFHPIIAAVLAFAAGNGLCSTSNPLYYILPSYQDFNVFFQVFQGTLMHLHDVVMLSLYALDFVVIMLMLALWRFHRKELVSP